MSRWVESLAFVAALATCGAVFAQSKGERFPGIGRNATPQEIAAWDIDVRADFTGLPRGAGSVAKGQDVWEAKCASCHGVFGESNSVFNPLIGGTTKEDIRTGRVANLKRADYPGRTTMMKITTISTLWDYINRAMPWNQPKSLTVEEVYAVTAYMLNLADIVPADFTLSDRNIAEVQQRMPNRNGMTTDHAMWPGPGLSPPRARPDVRATACMKDCPVDPKVTSMLPAFARNAHGNLADQNRAVGPQRGAQTDVVAATPPAASSNAPGVPDVQALLRQNNCIACHAADTRLVGPSWAEVANRHAGKVDYLADRIKAGSTGVWGTIPMPPQTIDAAQARQIADWLAAGARR